MVEKFQSLHLAMSSIERFLALGYRRPDTLARAALSPSAHPVVTQVNLSFCFAYSTNYRSDHRMLMGRLSPSP